MRAGLTRDEIRRAVREGLDAGDLSWPTVGETDQQRLERFSTVRDYLEERYMAGYSEYLGRLTSGEDSMAPETNMVAWRRAQTGYVVRVRSISTTSAPLRRHPSKAAQAIRWSQLRVRVRI